MYELQASIASYENTNMTKNLSTQTKNGIHNRINYKENPFFFESFEFLYKKIYLIEKLVSNELLN